MFFDELSFKNFILQGTNRKDFIISELKKNGIECYVMPVENKNHIYVKFPSSCYNPEYRIKTVIAHYDIVSGSPGANDNSFAVFTLIEFAKFLNETKGAHNIRLIFTDGEEFSGCIKNQGSFALASLFKKLSITKDFIFVFDCMGRGNIPVLAKSSFSPGISKKFYREFSTLENCAKSLLYSANSKYLVLPVPYSDNAGFLANGLFSCAVTMLPENEANLFMYNLMKNPLLEDYVLNNRKKLSKDECDFFKNLIPETWKKFHTQNDDFSSLTLESFSVMMRILFSLSKAVFL